MSKPALPSIAIVAPLHIQPSKAWIDALISITKGKENVSVIIVKDTDIELDIPTEWDIYDYERQAELLGDKYERFQKFHKSSACKNFGHALAYKSGVDIVMGIDSDCIVPPNFIASHLEALMSPSYGMTNPLKHTKWFPRGYPFSERTLKTILSLGLWENELDLYGTDRLAQPSEQTVNPQISILHDVADGYIPLSGMNWACWREAIPALLFLPNFEYQHGETEFKFRRHDDIWGGFIFQTLMNEVNHRIKYGSPIVWHDTKIDAQADADEEVGMIEFEKGFMDAVLSSAQSVVPADYMFMFQDFAETIAIDWVGTEWEPLIDPINLWVELIQQPWTTSL